jgi:transposase InsO family protein
METFLTFGFPKTIKSDNGKEFINDEMEYICELAKVKHNRIIAHNHHANGTVERQNRTICDTLNKLVKSIKDGHPDD